MLVLLLTVVGGQASAASKPKLLVAAPNNAPVAYGNVPVRATLKSKKSAKVSIARFYLNGRLITTDRSYPFSIKRGFKFDTRTLSATKPFLDFLITYEQGKKPGKVTKNSVRKRVRLKLTGLPNPNVSAKGSGSTFDPANPGYPLAYSEEFDGPSLDTSIWNDQRLDSIDENDPLKPAMSRPYNFAEGAAYNPDNVSIEDGKLKLAISDAQAPDPSAAGLSRSTGMVNSRGNFAFKYGYVETRAMVPECNGCWPSFWIMPATGDNWPPEIDIFEFFQFSIYSKKYPHSVFHWTPDGDEGDDQFPEHYNTDDAPVPSPKPQEYGVTHPAGVIGNYLNSWHTYGLRWTHDFAEIYVDGKLGARITGASKLPQEPMYLIYMMAICRVDHDPTGDIVNGVDTRQCTPETGTPAAGNEMKVDYMRVYSDDTSP
jgi:beta-glucanase (GH16 family)